MARVVVTRNEVTPQDCEIPCYSIDGFTNSFFDVSGCSSCTANTNYTGIGAWDGVFRADIPVIAGERNTWTGCNYLLARNGGEVKSYAGLHNGKKLAAPAAGDGDALLIGPSSSLITIRCETGGANAVIWQGTHDSRFPDVQPLLRSGGCATDPQQLTLTKISSVDCICDEFNPSPCPDAADCDACETGPTFCWTFIVTGFTGGCAILNGTHGLTDEAGGCVWSTQPPFSTSPETLMRCDARGDDVSGGGVWVYQDGIASGTGIAVMGPMLEDDNCPPKPTESNPTEVDMWGKCACSSQSGTLVFYYGLC